MQTHANRTLSSSRHPCASQTWRFSRLRGLAVANAFRNRLLSSSSSPCLTCAIYVVWNSLETGPVFGAYSFLRMKGDVPSMWHMFVRSVVGRYEGLAPSMSPKGSLMLRKKIGCNPAQKVAKKDKNR